MPRPSYSLTEEHIETVKQAMLFFGFTQSELAKKAGYSSYHPVARLLKGEPIDVAYFRSICKTLRLNWQDMAGIEHPRPKQKTHDSCS